MKKAALAGALMLATMGLCNPNVATAQAAESPAAGTNESGTVLTRGHIARFRAGLHLTSQQQVYWAPVERAMADIATEQSRKVIGSFTQRVRSRLTSITVTADAARRLMSAAGPLLNSLDEDQKHTAMRMARSMGFDQYVSNF